MKSYLKYSFLILGTVLFVSAAFPPAKDGMKFYKGNWASALAAAKSQNKLVFLDANAAWCRPCKKMEMYTFTDAAVGKYYNENFINVKMDMEKGEGVDLAKKLNIEGYPTLLYINSSGKVIHRFLGYKNPADFISLGKTAQAKK